MKSSNLVHMTAALALGATALLNSILNARALDNWQTINDFVGFVGMDAGGLDLQTDTSRTVLFDAGSADMPDVSGITPAIFRRSDDYGSTWTILDEFWDPDWQWACYRTLACDTDNLLYAGGFLYNNTDQGVHETWLIRERPTGVDWITTDLLFPDPPSRPIGNCAAIRLAPWGDVYAAGTYGTNWTVRKKAAGQDFYTEVDSYPATQSDQSAEGIAFQGNDGVFVVGKTPGTIGLFQWLVRRSTNQEPFTTVDRFVADRNWKQSAAYCVAVDASGRIYVAGGADYLKGQTTTYYWLVRRSPDGGKTWTTVDQFSYGTKFLSSTTHRPYAITFDSAGKILVCGYVATSSGDHWLVRKGTVAANGSVTWVVSDDYQLTPGQFSEARGITCDASGNTYASGRAIDALGGQHWVIRKLLR